MTSHQVKDQVRDTVEGGFDTLHRVADVVTFPLAPLDGAIHGVSRGLLNWVTDTHPGERVNKYKPANASSAPPSNPDYAWLAQSQSQSQPPPYANYSCYPTYTGPTPNPYNWLGQPPPPYANSRYPTIPPSGNPYYQSGQPPFPYGGRQKTQKY